MNLNRGSVRIVVAPDAFKGVLSAMEVADAIARGLRRALPVCLDAPSLGEAADAGYDVVALPVADGGEGTLEVLVAAGVAERERLEGIRVADGTRADVELGWLDDRETAVVESAMVCGWGREGGENAPDDAPSFDVTRASSRGVGELVVAAIGRGAQTVCVALGGTRTIDGGSGMLRALGARLLDDSGTPVGPGGGGLADLAEIDLEPARAALRGVELVGLCDVTSPLLGPDGARRYMVQKGADDATAAELEGNLARLASLAASELGCAPSELSELAGTGAAGGLGLAVAALGGSLRPGIDAVLDWLDADATFRNATLVISGEGRIDAQTGAGKAVLGVARRAQRHGVPTVVLCGVDAVTDEGPEALAALRKHGVAAVLSIAGGPVSRETALARTAERLEATAGELGGLVEALRR